MGKSPAMPPPIWKKPSGVFCGGLGVPLGQLHHVLDAGADGVDLLHVAGDAVAGVHVAERRVFPAGHEHGQVLLCGGEQPAVLGIDLVGLFQIARKQNLVHELVREEALAGLVGADPLLEHLVLDAAHGLHLGDAGVGDAVHVAGRAAPLRRRASGRGNAGTRS